MLFFECQMLTMLHDKENIGTNMSGTKNQHNFYSMNYYINIDNVFLIFYKSNLKKIFERYLLIANHFLDNDKHP